MKRRIEGMERHSYTIVVAQCGWLYIVHTTPPLGFVYRWRRKDPTSYQAQFACTIEGMVHQLERMKLVLCASRLLRQTILYIGLKHVTTGMRF